MRILVPSIVDPAAHPGGAGAVTQGFLTLLRRRPLNAAVDCVSPSPRSRAMHRIRQLTSVTRSVVSPLPSKVLFSYSARFRGSVMRALREAEYDLILLNGSDLLWLLPELPSDVPLLLLAHNIEHQLFSSQIRAHGAAAHLLQRLLARDCRRLREFELSGMRRCEAVIFLSSRDAEFARAACPSIEALVVPPLFDYAPPKPSRVHHERRALEIGFLANFDWWPNREGLRWFLKEVFPSTNRSLRLHLFGERSQVTAPHHPRIVPHGFQRRIEDLWQLVDFMICPIHSGSGVNVKLAEAVYNCVPVLATSFAARGLPLSHDPGVVLLDSAPEWISFLASTRARELGARTLPAGMAEPFRVESHIEPAQTFIQGIVRKRFAECG